MLSKLRPHLTFANVASGLSLFLVLTGGTAMAVDGSLPGQNTVGSADIINGEVQAPDIAQGAVLSDEIANGGVQGTDVKNDALTSADIAQDTLGFRETATSASDEIRVGSIDEWDVADNSLGFLETPTSASDEIRFGSIDHFDVANGSLRREDFEAGALPITQARFNGSSTNSLSNDFEQITARFAPEGSWVAFANVRSFGGPNGQPRPQVHCELRDPGGVIGWGIDSIPDDIDDRDGDFDFIDGAATFTIQGGSQAPPGGGHIISVWCKTSQGPGTELDAQLMLIKVDHFE